MGVCKECTKERFIQNKTKGLCGECVYKRNHGGKSQVEVLLEKMQVKSSIKKDKKILDTEFKSERELFSFIWRSRPHFSELTGEPLLPEGDFKWHWQFLHILNKQSYSRYKLDPENIVLGLPEEHERQDDFLIFRERKEKMLQKALEERYERR